MGKVKYVIGLGMNVWNVVVFFLSMCMLVVGRFGINEILWVYDLVIGKFYY